MRSLFVGSLLTVCRVAEPRQANLAQILVAYPAIAAAGPTVMPGDGTAHLGLVLEVFDPYPCTKGYEGTVRRSRGRHGRPRERSGILCRTARQHDRRPRRAERPTGGLLPPRTDTRTRNHRHDDATAASSPLPFTTLSSIAPILLP